MKKIHFNLKKILILILISIIIIYGLLSCTNHRRTKPVKAHSRKIKVKRNIYYCSDKFHKTDKERKKHRLDIFYPKEGKNHPVIFFVHGGSWSFGDKSWYNYLGYSFARRGFVTVITSYRLAPDNVFPSQPEDVATALGFVYDNIAEYNGDRNKIFIGGHSAGAHLVALVILDEKYQKFYKFDRTKIKGVTLLSGVYIISEEFLIKERYSKLAYKVFTEDKKVWRDASPFYHIEKKKLPPFLICYAEKDWLLLKYQSKIMHKKLVKYGIESEIHEVPTKNHYSEIIFAQFSDDPLNKELISFINKILDREE